MGNDYIRHQGKVERVENQKVYVRIEQKAACSDCHAGSVCLASDKKDKIIEVTDYIGSYEPQDDVLVSVKQSMGLFAVFIAFVIPLFLVILTAAIVVYASRNDVAGGLAGLSTLFPYYFALYLMRDKVKKKFVFSLSLNPAIHPSSTNVIN